MRLRPLFIVGLLLAMWTSAAQAQDLPGLGTTARGTLAMGGRAFPLPEGDWTVVGVQDRQSSSSTPVGRVILAQLANDKLSRWIYLSTDLAWNGSGSWSRNKEYCDHKSVHYGYSDDFQSTKDTECWMLNHRGMTLGERASQIWIDFYRWSDSRGRPNTALALEYYIVKSGHFVAAQYYFNPVLAGFPDTPTASWRGNPWHADMASKDQRKLEYLRGLKTTGQDLFEKLKAAMK